MSCRWLSVRLETLGALAALAAAVLTVEQRGAASTFGLVLSYALSITMLTSMTVRTCQIYGVPSSRTVALPVYGMFYFRGWILEWTYLWGYVLRCMSVAKLCNVRSVVPRCAGRWWAGAAGECSGK